jgi:hypothetical protein
MCRHQLQQQQRVEGLGAWIEDIGYWNWEAGGMRGGNMEKECEANVGEEEGV